MSLLFTISNLNYYCLPKQKNISAFTALCLRQQKKKMFSAMKLFNIIESLLLQVIYGNCHWNLLFLNFVTFIFSILALLPNSFSHHRYHQTRLASFNEDMMRTYRQIIDFFSTPNLSTTILLSQPVYLPIVTANRTSIHLAIWA